MCLLGPRSFVPLNALSKKQTSVSKSTPEAEIVSLDHAVHKLGLPALSMWEYMLGRRFRLRVMEGYHGGRLSVRCVSLSV